METNPLFAAEDSDSEVFDGTSPSDHALTASLAARTNSSSSSRKSSYEDLGGVADDKRPSSVLDNAPMEISMAAPTDPVTPPTMVEWKPHPQDEVVGGDSPQQVQNGYRGSSNSDAGGELGTPPPQEDLKALYGSAVTVTIDPPRDDGNDEVASYLEGGRSNRRGGIVDPQTQEEKRVSLAELFDGDSDEEGEEFDLFKDLDDVDLSEEDESEPPPPTKICLLSK